MDLKFIKADPSGNTTVFVTSPAPRDSYGKIAKVIMSDRHLAAEQVGYIENSPSAKSGFHMEMMGGEFCGNASRSFAAWLAMYDREKNTLKNFKGDKISFEISVSGASKPIIAEVSKNVAPYSADVRVEMPLPKSIESGENESLQYDLVRFEGIAHIILKEVEPDEKYVVFARETLNMLKMPADAFGVMFYDESKSFMTPAVYIGEVGSLVWENSCGSGTTALASAIAHKNKSDVKMEVLQPGGTLSVEAAYSKGKIERVYLSGTIRFTAEGTIYIDDKDIS
jgi:diaminopimelate epimerase